MTCRVADDAQKWRLCALIQIEMTVKKSLFRAYAAPVASEDEAMAFIESHRVPDATHNCWAWLVSPRYRMFDDGEPGGTAGRPILTAIEGQGFENVVVLVIRWFGGIKLGAGGLIRAYGGTASQRLRAGDATIWVKKTRIVCRIPFNIFPIIQARLADWEADSLEQTFEADGVRICLAVPDALLAEVTTIMSDLTRGDIAFTYPE
ncbi:MAG: YigZ family protein [Acetobacteraceae bacterium]